MLPSATITESKAMEFLALHEEKPGDKWQRRFAGLWPRYRGWYLGEGLDARP